MSFSIMRPSNEDISSSKETASKASTAGSGSKLSGRTEQEEDEITCPESNTVAKKETRAVNIIRILVLVFLGTTAVLSSIGVHQYAKHNEREAFEADYDTNAHRIIESFRDAVERKVGAIHSMSTAITSYALDTKSEFPFVTIPNFALRGADLRIQADAFIVHWMPLVTDEKRAEWEKYALENRHQIDDAFQEDMFHRKKQDEEFGLSYGNSRVLQKQASRNNTILDDESGYHTRIWSNGGVTPMGDEEEGSGPYLPLWQRSPINGAKQRLLNINAANSIALHGLLPVMLRTHEAIMNRAVVPAPSSKAAMEQNLALGQYRETAREYLDDPVTYLAHPVFDTFEDDRQLAGMLATNVYWKLFLTNILPESATGYDVVLENSFNQSLAFRIDGPDVIYIGEGDLHDNSYDHLEECADINEYTEQKARPETRSYTWVPLSKDLGKYKLCVYPSNATEDEFVSNQPLIYAFVIASVFLFNALMFLVFVYAVEQRQRTVMDKVVKIAAKATAQERELNLFLAHEVRNPLSSALVAHNFASAAVKDSSLMMDTDESSRSTLQEDLDTIGSSLHFINDFLRSMLDINRAAANKLIVKLAPTDLLKDVLEPVCNILSHRDVGIDVVVDCPKNLVVATDCLRLKQVALNLGRNAAKFVNSGYIRFRAAVVGGNVELYIEDSGPGIPIQKRDELFDKFQSSLDVLSQGTGIGLSLCKSIVGLLQGDIWMDESYDSGVKGSPGARFVVQLNCPPLSPESLLTRTEVSGTEKFNEFQGNEGLVPTRPEDEDSVNCEKETSELPEQYSVLFVDDDVVLRKLFSRSLKRLAPSWTIEEAANGETALRLVENEQFDLIFMDQYMASTEKQLLGTETVRALRTKGVTSKICGLSANDIEDAFVNAGSDFFLLKPLPCKKCALKSELIRMCFSETTRSPSM